MSAAATRPSAWSGWLRGAQLAVSRLRYRSLFALVILTLGAGAVSALVLRHRTPLEAPGHAVGIALRWLVPLATFSVCSLCIGRSRMDDSIWPAAVHGLPKRQLVLGVASVALVGSALLAALLTVVTLVLAYGRMPGLAADLATSTWISALGATCYAGWFSLGASFLRLGRGRWVPLIADFTLGATGSVVAIVWPRPHLLNLAGGDALLDISQPTSSVLLAASTCVVVCLAAMRAGD